MSDIDPFHKVFQTAVHNDCAVMHPLVSLHQNLPALRLRQLIQIADGLADESLDFTISVNAIMKERGIKPRFELRCPCCGEEHCSAAERCEVVPRGLMEHIANQMKDQTIL